MGAHKLTTEARLPEGSRCGRGRPPEQRESSTDGSAKRVPNRRGVTNALIGQAGIKPGLSHHQRSGGVESRNAATNTCPAVDGTHMGPRPAVAAVARGPLHHLRPLSRSSAASTSASSITKSWRLISSAFKQAHMSLSRAQLSPSASEPHGFSSLAVDAELSPAGAIRPAGGFFSSGISSSRMFVEPSGRLARASESPIAGLGGMVGRFTKREQPSTNAMGVVNMGASFGASQWKDRDSLGKEWQEQRNLALPPAEVPAINQADGEFIARSSWEGACRYAVQRSRKDDYEVADDIGISHSYMCKVLKGTAGLWGRRLVKFMHHTQSVAPLQWLADQMGCDVVPRSSQAAEIARLRALLAQAERSAA